MPNILEFAERLRGLRTEYDVTRAKRLSEEEVLRLEEKRLSDERKEIFEQRQRKLEEIFQPILKSINKELLCSEGVLKTESLGIKGGLELVWGSQHEMGGCTPTHSISVFYDESETKFGVQFGWEHKNIFDINNKDWKNHFFELITVAFKEDGFRRNSHDHGCPDN